MSCHAQMPAMRTMLAVVTFCALFGSGIALNGDSTAPVELSNGVVAATLTHDGSDELRRTRASDDMLFDEPSLISTIALVTVPLSAGREERAARNDEAERRPREAREKPERSPREARRAPLSRFSLRLH